MSEPLARIVHLSDLHLGADADQAASILDPLVRELAALRQKWAAPAALLTITGDLHDSADVAHGPATEAFSHLLGRIRRALGGDVPTVLLPGNHDRRTHGLLRPYETELLESLARVRAPRVHVAGTNSPFLAELLPDDFHGLPCLLAVIDSSYTPSGIVSAGGLLRAEDLLEIEAQIRARGAPPHRPLVLLTHHHLVPTPVTDTSRIDADTSNPILRWLARNVLAGLISYADHEEWMMTALGAGTALSTLQSFGRPVLVLHGHKHYPTARALAATLVDHGDVALLSAGSVGLALPLDDGDEENVAPLWPSFHVIDVEPDGTYRTRTVAFYRDKKPAERDLFTIRATGPRWHVSFVDDRIAHVGPRLVENHAEATLRPCSSASRTRWDVLVERRVLAEELGRYHERVRAAPGARFSSTSLPRTNADTRRIALPVDGTRVRFELAGGAARSVDEALRLYGPLDPFEGVEVMNRYESKLTRLVLRGLPAETTPFGSVVDLTRGNVAPADVKRDGDAWVVTVAPCPPRMQLRIQWRPERSAR